MVIFAVTVVAFCSGTLRLPNLILLFSVLLGFACLFLPSVTGAAMRDKQVLGSL